jgi:hypothetical protein
MRDRNTRDCWACGRRYACSWVNDAWVCRYKSCGSEWYDEDFSPPDLPEDYRELSRELGTTA